MITHDLGVVAEVAQQVAVMYAGQVGGAGAWRPSLPTRHPYTIGLMGSVLQFGARKGQLPPIPGSVPLPESMPKDCRLPPAVHLRSRRRHAENRSSRAFGADHPGRLLPRAARNIIIFVPLRNRGDHAFPEARASAAFPGPKTLLPGNGLSPRSIAFLRLPLCRAKRWRSSAESGSGNPPSVVCCCACWPPAKGACFTGEEITDASECPPELQLRRELQIIFRDPASLNVPRMTVGQIVGEPLWLHQNMKKKRIAGTALPSCSKPLACLPFGPGRYPRTSFSGGQRQRIGITRALASGPNCCWAMSRCPRWTSPVQAQVVNLLEA